MKSLVLRSSALRRWWIPGLLLCALLSLPAGAAALDLINSGSHIEPNLAFGNAHKIVTGKFNRVHAVFAQEDPGSATSGIFYASMQYDTASVFFNSDPYPWQEDWTPISSPVPNATLPALAANTDGRLAVVFVSKTNLADAFGSIWYTSATPPTNPLGSIQWATPKEIVHFGTEPSVVAENNVVHVAWTTGDRVQYLSFSMNNPVPPPVWMGNVAAFTNCAGETFHQPSIALVHPPCDPLDVRIASLFAKVQEPTGLCQGDAKAGPRIFVLDNATTAWSESALPAGELIETPSSTPPDAVALSLSANRVTGDFYLAWSDELAGLSRTRLGRGLGTAWTFETFSFTKQHIHVAARSGTYPGQFRIAVSDTAWDSSLTVANGNATLGSWITSVNNFNDGTQLRYPQAFYWRRCAAHRLNEITFYTGADDGTNAPNFDVATDQTETPSSCLPAIGNVLLHPDCLQSHHLSIGQLVLGNGQSGIAVDLGETAWITSLTASGAEITTLSGGTILATWTPGEVLSTWDNGFTVATSRDSVRFVSDDTSFELEDVGVLGEPAGK